MTFSSDRHPALVDRSRRPRDCARGRRYVDEDRMSAIQRIVCTGCGLLFALALVWPQAAKAIEVQCIEASKYKYLYQMFDNDRAKFAEFLRVSASALPDGEVCRAGIITGKIEMSKEAREDGRDSDYKTLLSFI